MIQSSAVAKLSQIVRQIIVGSHLFEPADGALELEAAVALLVQMRGLGVPLAATLIGARASHQGYRHVEEWREP